MSRSKHTSRILTVANAFGALGYLSLIVQWAWTGLILAYPIIMKANRDDLWWLSPNCRTHEPTPTQPIDFGFATPVVSLLAIIIALIIVGVSVLAIIRLPKNVGETGARLTQTAANAIIPVVAHTKDIPKAKRKRLSFKIIVALKCICTVMALALLLLAHPIGRVTFPVIWATGMFCFVCTMVYWLIQYIAAQIGRVPQHKLW